MSTELPFVDDFRQVGTFLVDEHDALLDRARVLGLGDFVEYLDAVRLACRAGDVTDSAIQGIGFVTSLLHSDAFEACATSMRDCPEWHTEYN